MNIAGMYKEMESSPAWQDLMERLEKDIENEMVSFFDADDRVDAEDFRKRVKIKKEFLIDVRTIVANTILTKEKG